MNQLIFKFPFKTNYYEKDFYVSSGNFKAYQLIESCPNWPDKWLNIYGPQGCGKTHLANILKSKINAVLIEAKNITDSFIPIIEKYECVIIDNYHSNIDENILYSILNHTKQLNKYILINSKTSISELQPTLKDLTSRLKSFIGIGIELPNDDLLRVIISKSFSDKQIDLNIKNLEYIIKNIDRSYDKVFNFVKKIDNLSLSSGKSININLIKKVLKNE